MYSTLTLFLRTWTFFIVCLAALLFGVVSLFAVDVPIESRLSEHWQSTEREYEEKMDRDRYNQALDRIYNGEGSEKDSSCVYEGWEKSS